MMDELVNTLATSARVSLENDDIFLIHPRYAQYKPKSKTFNQEERRREWLQHQKDKRMQMFNNHRAITEKYSSFVEKMELGSSKKKISKKSVVKQDVSYKDWIMMSEWLIDVPQNLHEDWICTICPEGKRVLVVADKGSTCAYSRKGDFLIKFPSALPGGCGNGSRGYTVLDCIWHHPTKRFYILDVLIWGVPLTNCEAELRFFWLTNKFSEIPSLTECSPTNRHRFQLMDHKPVSQLNDMMSHHPPFPNNFPKADGILFFHKDCLYTSGKSPLVTWLKPFMVPDILEIAVAESYIAEKPPSYRENPVGSMEVEPASSEVEKSKKKGKRKHQT